MYWLVFLNFSQNVVWEEGSSVEELPLQISLWAPLWDVLLIRKVQLTEGGTLLRCTK